MNLHAIEQTQLRGQHRVDGVGRLKFDSTQARSGRRTGATTGRASWPWTGPRLTVRSATKATWDGNVLRWEGRRRVAAAGGGLRRCEGRGGPALRRRLRDGGVGRGPRGFEDVRKNERRIKGVSVTVVGTDDGAEEEELVRGLPGLARILGKFFHGRRRRSAASPARDGIRSRVRVFDFSGWGRADKLRDKKEGAL